MEEAYNDVELLSCQMYVAIIKIKLETNLLYPIVFLVDIITTVNLTNNEVVMPQ